MLAVVLGLLTYTGTLAAAVEVWSSSPDEQHGFLVIPIALLLLYLRRRDFPAATAEIDLRGLLLLALAAGMRIYSERYIRPWMDMWSLPLWVGGTVWLLGGFKIFRWAMPPIAFLFFMAPLPGQVQTAAGYPLQVMAATGGGWLLQLLGQPAFVAGTTILLDEHVLDVEQACAGLRMFHGMLAVAVGWSLFNRYRWPRFLAMMAIAPLVAILVNVLRIAVTGMLFQWFSGDAARAFTHDWAGILMIPTGAFIFFLVDGAADRLHAWASGRPDRWLMSGAAGAVLLLLISLVGMSAHKRQQEQAIDLVLDQAREMAASDDESQQSIAAGLYQRYLSVRPEDAAIISEVAEFNERQGRDRWPRAARYYELAWRLDPSRQQDAVRSLSLLQRLGAWRMLWTQSQQMAPRLLEDARLLALRLRTLAIGKLTQTSTSGVDVDEMFSALRESVEVDGEHFEHMWRLALLTRMHPDRVSVGGADGRSQSEPSDPTERDQRALAEILDASAAKALAIIDDSIAKHPGEARPLLYRVSLLQTVRSGESNSDVNEQIDKAIAESLTKAMEIVSADFPLADGEELELATGDPLPATEDRLTAAGAYQIAGRRAYREGNLERARRLLIRSQQLNPTNYQTYLFIARTIPDDAVDQRVELFTTALEQVPTREVTLVLSLAEAYWSQGREADAEALLQPLEQHFATLGGPEQGQVELMLAATRASGLAQQQRPVEAAELLAEASRRQPVIRHVDQFPSLYARVQFQLGSLYRTLSQDAAAAAAFERGGNFDSESPILKINAAVSYEATGNLAAALQSYRQAAEMVGKRQPQIYLSIARVLLAQQRQAADSERDLEPARSMIRFAVSRGAEPGKATGLMAESYVVEGDFTQALRVIDSQIKETPDVPQLFFSRAVIRQLAGDEKAAMDDVARYREAGATPAEALLLKVLLYERAGKPQQAAAAVRDAEDQLSDEEMKVAQSQIVAGTFRRGEIDQGLELLGQLATRYPNDLPVQRLAAEIFADVRREQEVIKAEQQLRQIEGDNGTLWRATRAARLLRTASSSQPDQAAEQIQEAEQLVRQLERLLPDWPRIYSLRGQLAEFKGSSSQALEAYEAAWSAGMRDAALASRILNAFNRTGQSELAAAYISQLEDLVPQSTSLFDRAMPQYVQGDKSEYVLQLARRWADQDPSPGNLVRLGQTLMAIAASGRGEAVFGSSEAAQEAIAEADSVIQRAIEKEPDNFNAWVASFQLQASVRQDRDGAIEKLKRLSEQLQIAPLQRAFVLAQLHYMIGEHGRAGRWFEKAVALASDASTPAMQRIRYAAAEFLASRRPERAMQLAREQLTATPEFVPAKRLLIRLLAERETRPAISEALQLQQSLPQDVGAMGDDQKRMRARLLMTRADLADSEKEQHATATADARATDFKSGPPPAEDRARAIELLSRITPRSAEDAELLAQLHAADENPLAAFNLYRESLRLQIATPERLVQFLEFWNQHYASEGAYQPVANGYFNDLKRFPTAASQWLRLRLQRAQIESESDEQPSVDAASTEGERDRAILAEYVESFVPAAGDPRFAASVYQLVEGLIAADRTELIPAAVKQVSASTNDDSAVAESLALAVVELARGERSSDGGIPATLTDLLQTIVPVSAEVPVELKSLVGDAYYVAGDAGVAAGYYRQALKAAPDRVDTLNNLALVLAADGSNNEQALAIIDRAMELEPENAYRLDTKLVVAMLQKDWELAEEISGKLAESFDPQILLHRAYLAMRQQRTTEAAELFSRSRDAGVHSVLLSPEDKQFYQVLRKRFLTESKFAKVSFEITIGSPSKSVLGRYDRTGSAVGTKRQTSVVPPLPGTGLCGASHPTGPARSSRTIPSC